MHQDASQAAHGLLRSRGVDQVAVAIDPQAGPPDHHRGSHGDAPHRSVVQVRAGPAVVHDQRQVLPSERDAGPGARTAPPRPDVEPAVGRSHDGRHSGLHRLKQATAGEVAAAAVLVLEAAVERREQRTSP